MKALATDANLRKSLGRSAKEYAISSLSYESAAIKYIRFISMVK
jgi:hypothetical protein